MTLRSAWAGGKPVNDNARSLRGVHARSSCDDSRVPRLTRKIMQPKRWAVVLRLLMLGSFSAVVLVAVSGAFLIGLALVGLLTAVIAACGLIRRNVREAPQLERGLSA